MNKSLSILILATVLLFSSSVIAADKVVVIPLFKCSDGLTDCAGQCVDTQNNPSYCGNGICKKPDDENCIERNECLSCACLGNQCKKDKFVFVSRIMPSTTENTK